MMYRMKLGSIIIIILALHTVHSLIQGDQLNIAVLFWYLVKSDLSSVRYCTRIHWTSHFLQRTRNTRRIEGWGAGVNWPLSHLILLT